MDGFQSFRNHVNPVLAELETLTGIAANFIYAKGCEIIAANGDVYLDFLSSHGCFALGHNPDSLIEGLREDLTKKYLNVYGIGINPHMGELAEKICTLAGSPFQIAFFANSGSEAVEGALKIARAATRRLTVLYCCQAYHGTTLGSLSMMASGPFRDPFEPLLENFIPVPYNDLNSLKKALQTYRCAAFVVEPIQAEAGVIIPDESYLEKAQELCREYGSLMISDEVQTAFYRAGRLFSFSGETWRPDIVALAKALGGGLVSIGAYITSREIFNQAYGNYTHCSSHHNTFGGNTLACRIANQTLDLLARPEIEQQVHDLSHYLLTSLQDRFGQNRFIQNIRGQGLLIGIEFRPNQHPWLEWQNLGLDEFAGYNAIPSLIMKQLFKNKIITGLSGHNWNVLKLEPPLTISMNQIDCFLDRFEAALNWLEHTA
jgi:putrescine aminotransferase